MAKNEEALVAQYYYPFGRVLDEAYSDVIIRREPKYRIYPLEENEEEEEDEKIPVELIFRQKEVPILLVTLGYISEISGPSKYGNVMVTRFKNGEILCSNYIVDKNGDLYGTLYSDESDAEMNLSQVLACKCEAERVWATFLERDDNSAFEFINDPFDGWYD